VESVTLTLTSEFDSVVKAEHTFETLAVGEPVALILIDGDEQTGYPSTTLAEPLWLRVVDADGYGVPGVTVAFAITETPGGAAGAALGSPSAVSDMQGDVQVTFTLGSKIGAYLLKATAGDVTLDGSPMRL